MPDEQPIFGGRYQIVRHIARGGMAQVYLARDTLLDRPVALKVLFPELSVDQAFVERFRREAQAAANLSHPNIVSIYDWGQGDRTYYIVMEYVDGETLSARIRRGPVPADEAAGIAIATAGALAFAHQRNVIHRDVKPGNVLIDRSGQVKVADFGIARAVGASENLTQAGAVMGTATYFSPEQAQGFAVDARSDVYSLGVVLYEMAVGKPPFQGDSPVAIAYQHVREAPPAPRTRNGAIPAAYEAVVLKALAKAPAERYQTADALRADLERFRTGQRVHAATPAGADQTMVAGAAVGAAAGATGVLARGVGVSGGDVTTALASSDATTVNAASAAATGRRPMPPPVLDHDPTQDTGPVEEQRPSRRRWYIAALALLVAALALIGFFVGRNLGYFGGAKTLTVPDLAGKPAPAARTALQVEGFGSVTEATVPSPTVPVGDVVDTRPAAGTRQKANRPVVIDVSAGPNPITFPSQRGKPEQAAVAFLTGLGFKTTVTTRPSDTVPAGDVIRTNPPGGTPQPPHKLIAVVVSSGHQKVTIPSFTNQSPTQAGGQLQKLGFALAGQQNESSADVPAGEVTRTVPAAGSVEPYGSAVTVFVSTGPAQVQIPSLVGQTENAASTQLAPLGLRPVFSTVTVFSPDQDGLVQSTSPPAGTSVQRGTDVGVVIGSYVAPATTTTIAPTTTTSSSSTTSSSTTSTSVKGPGAGRR